MNKLNYLILVFIIYTYYCVNVNSYHNKCLSDSYDRINAKFLKESFREHNGTNVVASPLSTILLLAIYSGGAPGAVREQIINNLGSNNYTQINQIYSALSQYYSSLNRTYFVLANKLFVAKQHRLTAEFKYVTLRSNTGVDTMDFSNSKAAVKAINRWAEDVSGGRIVKPVKDSFISPEFDIALLNIALFQGHWNVPFQKEETTSRDFYLDRNNVVQKPTMRIRASLRYHESKQLRARMIRLPYKEEGFEMLIVVPNELGGLSGLLDRTEEFGLMDDVRAFLTTSDVDFMMPRFEIASSHNLNDILPLIGFSKIFTENGTDVVRDKYVVVNKMFQKTYIKVNEEGTTTGEFREKSVIKKWRNERDKYFKWKRRAKPGTKFKKPPYVDQLEFLNKIIDCKLNETSKIRDIKDYTPPSDALTSTPNSNAQGYGDLNIETNNENQTVDIDMDQARTISQISPTIHEHPLLSFFRGIVPTVQDFCPDELLLLQINILNAIQEIKRQRSNTHCNTYNTDGPMANSTDNYNMLSNNDSSTNFSGSQNSLNASPALSDSSSSSDTEEDIKDNIVLIS